jgi:hypothetical protein
VAGLCWRSAHVLKAEGGGAWSGTSCGVLGEGDAILADTLSCHDEEIAPFIAANDPRQIIADCESGLGILDLHGIWKDDTGIAAEVAADAVRHLAGGYRHQPGYEQHWGSDG